MLKKKKRVEDRTIVKRNRLQDSNQILMDIAIREVKYNENSHTW